MVKLTHLQPQCGEKVINLATGLTKPKRSLRSDQLRDRVCGRLQYHSILWSFSCCSYRDLRSTAATWLRLDRFNAGSWRRPRGNGAALVGCRRQQGAGMDGAKPPKAANILDKGRHENQGWFYSSNCVIFLNKRKLCVWMETTGLLSRTKTAFRGFRDPLSRCEAGLWLV